MAEDRVERKVTVILATDVVGYSSKIEQNETQTLQTLKESLIADTTGSLDPFTTPKTSHYTKIPTFPLNRSRKK